MLSHTTVLLLLSSLMANAVQAAPYGSSRKRKGGLRGGVIGGIVVAAIAGVVILFILLLCCCGGMAGLKHMLSRKRGPRGGTTPQPEVAAFKPADQYNNNQGYNPGQGQAAEYYNGSPYQQPPNTMPQYDAPSGPPPPPNYPQAAYKA